MSETAPGRLMRSAAGIVAGVAIVVVPFGYATTAHHADVLLGAGFGIAVGTGVGLRRGAPWTGILAGVVVGIVATFVRDYGWGLVTLASGPLALGLIDGLGRSSFADYREVSREAFIVATLLTLGLLPRFVFAGDFQWPLLFAPMIAMPWTALLIGLVNRRRDVWRDAGPPGLLIAGAVGLPALIGIVGFAELSGDMEELGLHGTAVIPLVLLILALIVVLVPLAAFLAARITAAWLRPRLETYVKLVAYLRVMWVPIGGFAVGYVVIVMLFAGFYGMLERFSPGAFENPGTQITDWLLFALFTALGQDYAVVPASFGARALVGMHMILSVGWAVVLFAAVMSFIRPQLDRIALGHAGEDG